MNIMLSIFAMLGVVLLTENTKAGVDVQPYLSQHTQKISRESEMMRMIRQGLPWPQCPLDIDITRPCR